MGEVNPFPQSDLGAGLYVHESPSRRLPVYTRGNAGEVWPEVAYPLSISMSRSGPDPIGGVALDVGMFSAEELAEGAVCSGGCFGGYMYLNLSFSRVLAVRSPGVSIAESDAVYLGSEGVAPQHRHHRRDKSVRASLNIMRYMLGVLNTKALPELDADVEFVTGEGRRVPDKLGADDGELLAEIRGRMGDVLDLFGRHIEVSGKAGAALQYLARFCEKHLGGREVALDLVTGIGDVSSAAPSWGLWDLGRMVAADPGLSAGFDAGIDGLADRLETLAASGSAPAAEFNASFVDFLERFGSRGPNEWETGCETWGTKPDLALVLVDRMRAAEPGQAPDTRSKSLAAEREALIARSRSSLPWWRRSTFDKALRAATLFSVARERSKTTVVELIHQSRLLSRELAERTGRRVQGGTWEDMWFCLAEELDDYLADPAGFAGVIAERRATRERLKTRIPPFVFDGEMPPFESWESRERSATPLRPGQSIDGLAAVTGVAEGRAVVVTDPLEPGDLGPGDVLIAPLTDPAWTPLFVPVEAVVVDVGGQMSHAVIVAREFGMPCVVAATGATSRITTGDRVRVDGTAGTVTRLTDSSGET